MKSQNAPFNEFGQSMILRDIEILYQRISAAKSALADLETQLSDLSSQVNASLGSLGTMAYQNANAVAITGGTIASATGTTLTLNGQQNVTNFFALKESTNTNNAVSIQTSGALLQGSSSLSTSTYPYASSVIGMGTVSANGGLLLSGTYVNSSGGTELRGIIKLGYDGSGLTNGIRLDTNGFGAIQLVSGVASLTLAPAATFNATTVTSVAAWTMTSLVTTGGITATGGVAVPSGASFTLNSSISSLTEFALSIQGNQVVGSRLASITAPTGGATVDAQARTAINTIISRLATHGLTS